MPQTYGCLNHTLKHTGAQAYVTAQPNPMLEPYSMPETCPLPEPYGFLGHVRCPTDIRFLDQDRRHDPFPGPRAECIRCPSQIWLLIRARCLKVSGSYLMCELCSYF